MTAIVFDLDGTLIDSAPDIHAAVNAVLAEQSLSPLSLETVTSFVGNGVPKLIERTMKAAGIPFVDATHQELIAQFLAHYEKTPADKTTLYPGVVEALNTLSGAGHRLGVCTNKPEAPTRSILDVFGIAQFFDAVVGGDSLSERKPHPAPLLHVIDILDAERSLYVGDSEVDAETAARAAVPFAIFTQGYRKTPVEKIAHNYAFSDFSMLAGIANEAFSGEKTQPLTEVGIA